jgi:hypothetical protein
MRTVVIALVTFVVSAFLGNATAVDPPKPSAELRVLEDMIGTWDEVMMNKPTEWTPKAEKSTTVTKRTWALGGKFMRADGAWQPAKTEFLHLLGYDPDAKAYRSWYFDAAGAMPRGSQGGTWDAKSKTLTWTGADDAGNKTAGTHKVIDKDHHEWTLVVTNRDGKVLLDLSGKCTRRKE